MRTKIKRGRSSIIISQMTKNFWIVRVTPRDFSLHTVK